MIGAIIGDVVGSRFEFNNTKNKTFDLLTKRSTFTDDTVLTVAVMDWLLNAEIKTQESAAEYLQKWAKKYPHSGFGGSFQKWMYTKNPKPYYSLGNGAAMRISPVGWVTNDETEIKMLSDIVTLPTHNHPEGMKAANVVSHLIWMGRQGFSKEEMKEYASKFYNLDFNYNELVHSYKFDVTCQGSVPQAIYCFLISDSFIDCLRTSISIGGDSDTIAAISCSIAEVYYQIDSKLIENVIKRLPKEMIEIVNEFNKKYGKNNS